MKSIKVDKLNTAVILGCCCSALLCSYTYRKLQSWKKRKNLLNKIGRKQSERKLELERLRLSHPFVEELVAITELNLEDLLDKLQSKELTASQVLKAFIAKAVRINADINCITEFVPHAKKLAEELDSLPSPKGPLHGLPVAVKDDHDIEGLDSTIGFAKNLYKEAKNNCVPVQILIDLGAVPFCKTNVPQALASINSDNPIFGTTYNALGKESSPGGSSGGSGSIVGAGGALLATGSDIAGSLRIPAHFHGLCTLRSTNGRLSTEGMQGNLKQEITINVVTGFITKDAKSQAKIFRLVTGDSLQNRYDAKIAPIPWNEMLFTSTKPLKIGYYTSLPIFPAFGDTPATVLRAKSALQSLNYELIEFPLPDSYDLSKSVFGLFWCDLGQNLLREFEDEPLSKSGAGVVGHAQTPTWMRKFLSSLFSIKYLPTYSWRMAEMLQIGLDCQTLDGFVDCVQHLKKIRNDMIKRMEDEGIDLILGPVMPFPSLEEKAAHLFAGSIIYTFLWNALDFPAGVVRFGTESGKLLASSDTQKDFYLEMVKKSLPTCVGFPINVQIIGKPFQEELVLRALCDLENLYEKQSLNHSAQNGINGI